MLQSCRISWIVRLDVPTIRDRRGRIIGWQSLLPRRTDVRRKDDVDVSRTADATGAPAP
jgi:hypothetical protein